MLKDGFGRRVDYLRLSVTDRCNLRCVYCLPASYAPSRAEGLSDDEVVELAGCFAELGVSSLRVTGGEPLVRSGLPELVGRLAALPGISDLSLSTNGVLLAPQARALKAAGLRRVNVSLDSLDPERFAGITRFGSLDRVLEGVEAALNAGLEPVKLNVVVARGVNDDEVGAFAALTRDRPLHVRFIELMPMGETGFFSRQRWVPLAEFQRAAGPLEAVPSEALPAGRGPATCFRRPGARGTVGFISALSCGFCSACNRVRLTSQGKLIPCLDGSEGVDLRASLLSGGRPAVRAAILAAVAAKPERHAMLERASGGTRLMCQVGG